MANPSRPVIQANIITSARTDLSRDQRRVFYLFLRHVHHKGWPEEGKITIKSNEYAAIYRVSVQEARDDLRRAINGFGGKCVTIYEQDELWAGNKIEVEYDWTSVRRKNHQRGEYTVYINPHLRQYLQPLASELPFTVMELEDLATLQGKWSQRLYESVCQFKSTGKFTVNLDTLAERWDLPPSYHDSWRDLERRVIKPATCEIKDKTSFKDLSYMVRRNDKGRVTGLIFTFSKVHKD